MVLSQLDIHPQKKEIISVSFIVHKNQLWIKDTDQRLGLKTGNDEIMRAKQRMYLKTEIQAGTF